MSKKKTKTTSNDLQFELQSFPDLKNNRAMLLYSSFYPLLDEAMKFDMPDDHGFDMPDDHGFDMPDGHGFDMSDGHGIRHFMVLFCSL